MYELQQVSFTGPPESVQSASVEQGNCLASAAHCPLFPQYCRVHALKHQSDDSDQTKKYGCSEKKKIFKPAHIVRAEPLPNTTVTDLLTV